MAIYYHNAIYLFIFNLIVDSYQFNVDSTLVIQVPISVVGKGNFAVPNKNGDQVIQQITIDSLPGNREIVTCYPLDGFYWNID